METKNKNDFYCVEYIDDTFELSRCNFDDEAYGVWAICETTDNGEIYHQISEKDFNLLSKKADRDEEITIDEINKVRRNFLCGKTETCTKRTFTLDDVDKSICALEYQVIREYRIEIKTETGEIQLVGCYFYYTHNRFVYSPSMFISSIKEYVKESKFLKKLDQKQPIDFIQQMMQPEYRDKSTRQEVFCFGDYIITNKAKPTNKKFVVYNSRAKQGEPGYWAEKPKATDESKSWCASYQFVVMSDGSYQVELDEMETFGSSNSHCGGGVISRIIPEEYFALDYDEFLSKVITVAGASYFGFSVDNLKNQKKLKDFFKF